MGGQGVLEKVIVVAAVAVVVVAVVVVVVVVVAAVAAAFEVVEAVHAELSGILCCPWTLQSHGPINHRT